MVTDELEVEVKGLVTFPMLNGIVKKEVGEGWSVDIQTLQKEFDKRVAFLSEEVGESCVRRFKIPIVNRRALIYG